MKARKLNWTGALLSMVEVCHPRMLRREAIRVPFAPLKWARNGCCPVGWIARSTEGARLISEVDWALVNAVD
ncbi:MAG: hypothetical protein AAGA58_04515 [Verrucomicrobiota bacterium]